MEKRMPDAVSEYNTCECGAELYKCNGVYKKISYNGKYIAECNFCGSKSLWLEKVNKKCESEICSVTRKFPWLCPKGRLKKIQSRKHSSS